MRGSASKFKAGVAEARLLAAKLVRKDGAERVADRLCAIGLDARHSNGVVVYTDPEGPPDLRARRDEAIRELDADGLGHVLIVCIRKAPRPDGLGGRPDAPPLKGHKGVMSLDVSKADGQRTVRIGLHHPEPLHAANHPARSVVATQRQEDRAGAVPSRGNSR